MEDDRAFAAFVVATGYSKADYLSLTMRERHLIIKQLNEAAKRR